MNLGLNQLPKIFDFQNGYIRNIRNHWSYWNIAPSRQCTKGQTLRTVRPRTCFRSIFRWKLGSNTQPTNYETWQVHQIILDSISVLLAFVDPFLKVGFCSFSPRVSTCLWMSIWSSCPSLPLQCMDSTLSLTELYLSFSPFPVRLLKRCPDGRYRLGARFWPWLTFLLTLLSCFSQ